MDQASRGGRPRVMRPARRVYNTGARIDDVSMSVFKKVCGEWDGWSELLVLWRGAPAALLGTTASTVDLESAPVRLIECFYERRRRGERCIAY